jgi:hypothetical protein
MVLLRRVFAAVLSGLVFSLETWDVLVLFFRMDLARVIWAGGLCCVL